MGTSVGGVNLEPQSATPDSHRFRTLFRGVHRCAPEFEQRWDRFAAGWALLAGVCVPNVQKVTLGGFFNRIR